ncbi:MAG TPA: GlsB/YeaQ/YmgE family stress response membrane protein [Terriglobia bacterium]
MLYWIIVGLIAGWLTGKIMKGSGYGVIGDIVLGIIGGFIGGEIMRFFNIYGGGLIYSIVVAVLGAVILVVIVRSLRRV